MEDHCAETMPVCPNDGGWYWEGKWYGLDHVVMRFATFAHGVAERMEARNKKLREYLDSQEMHYDG